MTLRKPTIAQLRVLRLLANGWQLGWSHAAWTGRAAWIQEGGIGRGGDTRTVHGNTFHALRSRSWTAWPTEKWDITDKGRHALEGASDGDA
jgi:hypothetical protein